MSTYRRPNVKPGTTAIYYRNKSENAKPYPVIIKSVNSSEPTDSSVDVVTIDGKLMMPAVRNIDDPWLELHPHLLEEFGCWEESEENKRLNQIEVLLERLAADVQSFKVDTQYATPPKATKPKQAK